MTVGIYFALPLLLILVAVQTTFFSYLSVLDVTIQSIPILVIAWALWRGRDSAEPLVVAFVGGFFIDLLSIGPIGVSSVALMIAVVTLTPIQANLINSRFLLPIILAGVAMFTYLLVTLIILRISGYAIAWASIANIPQSIALHAFLTMPVYWLLYFVSLPVRRRAQINI